MHLADLDPGRPNRAAALRSVVAIPHTTNLRIVVVGEANLASARAVRAFHIEAPQAASPTIDGRPAALPHRNKPDSDEATQESWTQIRENAPQPWRVLPISLQPHASRADVVELTLPDAVPAGLVLLRIGKDDNRLFTYGPDERFFLTLGEAEEAAGNFTAATDAYRRAIAANPEAAGAYDRLATVLARVPQTRTEARQAAEKAILLAPGDPERAQYLGTLAAIHEQEGDFQRGIAALERALALAARNRMLERHLARLIQAGERESPEKVLAHFLDAVAHRRHDAAARLSLESDVEHLQRTGALKDFYARAAQGAPFQRIEPAAAMRRGGEAVVRYRVVMQDGKAEERKTTLAFEKQQWKVQLHD
jgi:tetratricopeptide (TPR) repeat protein